MEQKTKTQPLVSVCVPTYNRKNKLKIAITKIQEQSYNNLEIIISDNCSTDGTEELCNILKKDDERIKYYKQETNIGPTANFEFARKQVSGKYFLLHGDDDYLDKNYIESCVKELEKDSSYVLVSGLAAYKKFGLGEITHYGNIIQPSSKFKIFRIINYLWNVQENSIFCGAYRTKDMELAYMPNVLAGDWIWMVQVLIKGKAKVIPNIHVIRSYGDSTSVSYESIIKSIGAPKWHAKYPNLAMSNNVFSFLKSSNIYVGIIGFFTLMIKGIFNNFKRYSGLSLLKRFIKRIYKK